MSLFWICGLMVPAAAAAARPLISDRDKESRSNTSSSFYPSPATLRSSSRVKHHLFIISRMNFISIYIKKLTRGGSVRSWSIHEEFTNISLSCHNSVQWGCSFCFPAAPQSHVSTCPLMQVVPGECSRRWCRGAKCLRCRSSVIKRDNCGQVPDGGHAYHELWDRWNWDIGKVWSLISMSQLSGSLANVIIKVVYEISRKFSQYLEKAPMQAFYLLKLSTSN